MTGARRNRWADRDRLFPQPLELIGGPQVPKLWQIPVAQSFPLTIRNRELRDAGTPATVSGVPAPLLPNMSGCQSRIPTA